MRMLSIPAILLLAAASGSTPGACAISTMVTFNQSFTLAPASSAADGLRGRGWLVNELCPEAAVHRVLFRLSDGVAVVLTSQELPRHGLTRLRIVDDRSGWWAELSLTSGLLLADTAQLAMPVLPGDPRWKKEYPLTLAFAASHQAPYQLETTTLDEDWVSRLAEGLAAEGLAAKLTAGMPQPFAADLSFLRDEAQEDGTLAHYAYFLELLARLTEANKLRNSDPFRGQPWDSTVGKLGRTFDDGARSFFRGFHSIDPADPLAGSHPGELAAAADRPAQREH